MKLYFSSSLALALAASYSSMKNGVVVQAAGDDSHHSHDDHHGDCTFGHLYLSDNSTSNVYVMDISNGIHSNDDIPTEPAYTLEVPSQGAGEFRLSPSSTFKDVGVTFYGDRSNKLAGGFVRMIDSGFHGDHYDAPSFIDNAAIDNCIGTAHFEKNDGTITVHCDGYYPPSPDADINEQVNTTVYVLDESLFGKDESAIIFTLELEGAHHGVAYTLDKRHMLHSLPTEERVQRQTNDSLPTFFRVIDFDLNILHPMENSDNKAEHCTGYHGSGKIDGSYALACNEDHAGMLIVDYDETMADETQAYSSHYLPYPTDDEMFSDHRTGTIVSHKSADHLISNFANRDTGSFHILGFHPSQSTSIETAAVFTLPGAASQCLFGFELSEGKLVYVMTPEDGTIHVLEFHDDHHWDVLGQKAIIPGMTACSEVVATTGIHQVFIAHIDSKILYAVNIHEHHDHDERRKLSGDDEGDNDHDEIEFEIFMNDIPFFANRMIVAGFTKDAACSLDEEDDEDDDEKDQSGGATVGISRSISGMALMSVTTLAAVFMAL